MAWESYISHHLQEVLEIADRVTVLRDGKNVGTVEAATSPKSEIISMMVGKDQEASEIRTRCCASSRLLMSLSGICVSPHLSDVSLRVKKQGEVLGITGLIGSGTETLSSVLSGRLVPEAGGDETGR